MIDREGRGRLHVTPARRAQPDAGSARLGKVHAQAVGYLTPLADGRLALQLCEGATHRCRDRQQRPGRRPISARLRIGENQLRSVRTTGG